HLVRDAADDAQHHCHHGALFHDRDLRQLRYRAHPHSRRSDRPDARICHLGFPGRDRGGRHSARRQRLAVHGSDPHSRRRIHPARHHSARKPGVMAIVSVARSSGSIQRRKSRSISRDNRRALRWSYFFLVVFAIFFLMPPLYMLITSLKTSAEISAATNPWWVYGPTLGNYFELLSQQQFLTYFRNSAIVSVVV